MVNNIQRNQEHLLILIITTNETLSNQRLLLTKSKMFIYLSNHPQLAGNKAKGRISKGVFQENKARQIFRKTNISFISNISFFGKFGVLCFFEIPLLRFALLSYYQRIFLQFKWEGHLNNVAPIVFFNFELLQLMIYKSVFSTDINGCLKIILDLLTFKEKIDQFSV